MAWENQIIGYKIRRFERSDVIPVDAKFIMKESGQNYLCGSYYSYEYFLYQIPIYKKVRTKKP